MAPTFFQAEPSVVYCSTAPSQLNSEFHQTSIATQASPSKPLRSKQGLSTCDFSPLVYWPLNPPVTKALVPEDALLIMGLAGVPKAQLDIVPPLIQPAWPPSKSSI